MISATYLGLTLTRKGIKYYLNIRRVESNSTIHLSQPVSEGHTRTIHASTRHLSAPVSLKFHAPVKVIHSERSTRESGQIHSKIISQMQGERVKWIETRKFNPLLHVTALNG